ncbi:MAG TPA: amidase family protein, partial [Chitinophagales bacterium]|nr:amidase family protein [Chitinophagales bacterium]
MKTIHTYDIGILEDFDATETALKINKKEISREEAVACAIDRAMFANPSINAIVTPDFERALTNANKKYSNNGVFAGVPTFIKDLNDYAGLPTLMGSCGTPSIPKQKNDPVVEQILKVTDSIVLGKSSSSEYGLLPCGETLQQGNTLNPWNLGHSTGGSSAGSAALVAAGVVPFAHANDGGGSIRIPA